MVADARTLPFDKESIDTIFMREALEHISDFMRVLNECYRVLFIGGTLLISVPNIYFYRVYLRWVFKNTMAVTREHIHAFREGELLNACSRFTHVSTWFNTSRWHTVLWYEKILPKRLRHRSLYMMFRKDEIA